MSIKTIDSELLATVVGAHDDDMMPRSEVRKWLQACARNVHAQAINTGTPVPPSDSPTGNPGDPSRRWCSDGVGDLLKFRQFD